MGRTLKKLVKFSLVNTSSIPRRAEGWTDVRGIKELYLLLFSESMREAKGHSFLHLWLGK